MRQAALWLLALLLWGGLADAQPSSTPNLAHPLLRGLLHWWRPVPGLTGGDKLYDLVPGTLAHLVLTNMGYSSTSGWSGATRQTSLVQLNFDGTNDYATGGTQNAFTNDTNPFTMCGWIYPPAIQTGTKLVFGANDGTAVNQGISFFWAEAGSNPRFYVGDTTGFMQLVTWNGGSWPAVGGSWQHWCIRHTGSGGTAGMMMFYNGVAQTMLGGQNNAFFSSYPVVPWTLGAACCATPGWYFDGAMDEVMLWGRALSDTEVSLAYQATLLGSRDFFLAPDNLVSLRPAGAFGSFFPWFGP